jgi:F-type H+-transporting ATPase subunit gamma
VDARRGIGQTIDLEPVGKKAIGLYKKRYAAANYEKTEQHYDNDLSTHYDTVRHRAQAIEVVAEHVGLLLRVDFDDVSEMARSIIERYERAEIDAVYVVYNEFKSVISQRVVVEKLLPIRKLGTTEITAAEEMTEEQREAAVRAAASSGVSVRGEEDEEVAEDEAKKFGTAEVDYIYDQAPERLFRHLMPRYVTMQIFHALLESAAAEHAARMTATDAATKNAGDLIDSLSLTMNRVRQAAITKEIIEIVSGAAAL